jgi:predicted nucleic acid-binding protein
LDAPRAIFDTNLYIKLLLSPDPDRTVIERLLRAAARRAFELMLPEDVIGELSDVVARRPYLSARGNQDALNALFDRVLRFATPLPLLEKDPPPIARDANDDYLITLSVLNDVDYIVTRDRDLLDLREVAGVRIVDPMTFLGLLTAEPE